MLTVALNCSSWRLSWIIRISRRLWTLGHCCNPKESVAVVAFCCLLQLRFTLELGRVRVSRGQDKPAHTSIEPSQDRQVFAVTVSIISHLKCQLDILKPHIVSIIENAEERIILRSLGWK